LSNDELLLPMNAKLSGGEMLRVVSGNGRSMLVPVGALMAGPVIEALRDDLAVLTARVLVLEAEIKTKKDKDKP
jgi:hypothetical protein